MDNFKTFPIIILIIVIVFNVEMEMTKIKFTKIECIEFDRPFASFKKCYLKALARDTVSLHLHVELHEVPVNNITVNAQLFQRGNGYRPFLYNATADFCIFLARPTRYMFWKIVYDNVKPRTNVNHTCPINHDVIIERLILRSDMLKQLPFPPNDYMIQLQFAAYNQYRAKVKTYIRLFD